MRNIFDNECFAKVIFENEHIQLMHPKQVHHSFTKANDVREFSDIQQLWVLIIEDIHPYLLPYKADVRPYYEILGWDCLDRFEAFSVEYFSIWDKAEAAFSNTGNLSAEPGMPAAPVFLTLNMLSGKIIHLLQQNRGYIEKVWAEGHEHSKLQGTINSSLKSIPDNLSVFGLCRSE